MEQLDPQLCAAVNIAIRTVRFKFAPVRQRIGKYEVYALPRPSGAIAWGVNSAENWNNIASGVQP